MNKTELVGEVSKKTGLTRENADRALGAVVEAITEALAAGEKVQLVGFGSFEVRERPERTGRNPRSGETIVIPAAVTPVFKPGKGLKDAVAK